MDFIKKLIYTVLDLMVSVECEGARFAFKLFLSLFTSGHIDGDNRKTQFRGIKSVTYSPYQYSSL